MAAPIPSLLNLILQLIPCLGTRKETPCPSHQEAAHTAQHILHASCCTSEPHTLSTLNLLSQECHLFPMVTAGAQTDNHIWQTSSHTEAKLLPLPTSSTNTVNNLIVYANNFQSSLPQHSTALGSQKTQFVATSKGLLRDSPLTGPNQLPGADSCQTLHPARHVTLSTRVATTH